MKQILFIFFIILFSANTFAQDDDAGVVTSLPLPVYFKTVNGKGTCGTAAEIRVYFNELPSSLPTIAQIRSEQRDVPGIVTGNIDDSEFAKRGYVSYCILSSDLLPAGKLSIRFHYEATGFDYWIIETKGKHVNMGHCP